MRASTAVAARRASAGFLPAQTMGRVRASRPRRAAALGQAGRQREEGGGSRRKAAAVGICRNALAQKLRKQGV